MPEPLRYARLVYDALRLTGQHPGIAAIRAGRILTREITCRLVGHDWSWPLAEALGTTRPVCERCLTAAPRGGRDG